MGDLYLNTKVLLQSGDKLVRGKVVHWKYDADCNIIGRSYQNPIMDTCLYEVEFPGGSITELTVNIIAKLMYASCYAVGNHIYC